MGEEISTAFRNDDDEDIIIISRLGELILVVEQEGNREPAKFRCDGSRLKAASSYFKQLLGSTAFREGKEVAKQHAEIQENKSNGIEARVNDLPRIKIAVIGQISQMKSTKPLMTDFLRIIHGYDIVSATRNPPAINIANLAIVADRFDAISAVERWSRSKSNALPRTKANAAGNGEAQCRQRLLTSLLFSNEAGLSTYSSYLIMQGSVMWRLDSPTANAALWWDIPRGVEEEMQFRRVCILQTLSSLQFYLLSLYSSKERQCRLGYDSSPQCDSFQLGEFVKYLTKLGTIDFQSRLLGSESDETHEGDIGTLIQQLRGCPSYQIDANHSHCGPKKLLLTGLDFIQDKVGTSNVGICLQCWRSEGHGHHFWSEASTSPYFNRFTAQQTPSRDNSSGCIRFAQHELAREFFTANDVNWESLLKHPSSEKPVVAIPNYRKNNHG